MAVVLGLWAFWVPKEFRPVVRGTKVAPDLGATLDWKRERFVQEERDWLLGWIEVDDGMADIRRRWWKTYAYWCIDGLSEAQQQQLEKHLIFWARRIVENNSQYGPGGWGGTGWERRS